MKLKNCIFLTTTALFSTIASVTTALAGDKIFSNTFDKVVDFTDKPNTGDTNTLVIYASIAIIAIIALVVINVKDSKKKKKNIEDKGNTEEK